MKLWKINCMEDEYPGMWQRWFKNQCVGVGWRSWQGYHLDKQSPEYGWNRVRKALQKVQLGDLIVVTLRGHRVGRIGQVTGKAFSDTDWNPLVPPSRTDKDGGIGRRIEVRWDMLTGPDNRDQVVLLPVGSRFNIGELRPTICEIPLRKLPKLRRVMNEPVNCVGLDTHFDYESALQGYIAAYPHRLEDGLLPHPDKKIRENVFTDGTRSDVLLIDREGTPLVVECKQGPPSFSDLKQLCHYMRRLAKKTDKKPRGILIHGGALKLSNSIRKEAKRLKIEIARYSLKVDFDRSK